MGGSSRESGYRKKGGEGERQREKHEGMKERERKFREIEGVERERGERQEDKSERGQ